MLQAGLPGDLRGFLREPQVSTPSLEGPLRFTMNCFTCNRSRRRRSRYDKDDSLEDEEGGRKEDDNELDAVPGEGDPEGCAITSAFTHSLSFDTPGSEADLLGPLPALPIPCAPLDMKVFIQELESVRRFQALHLQERRKDLSSCQNCLRTLRSMREKLQTLKSRLQKLEAELGIQIPPEELFPEERKEAEDECEEEQIPTPQAGDPGEKQAVE